MPITLSAPILLLAAVLQATIIPILFRILNAEPDLVFLIVLSWAIHAPTQQAIVWAFIGGIAADLLSAAPTGASVVGLLIVIGLVAALRGQLYRVGLVSLIGLTIVGTIFHKLAFLLIVTASGVRPPLLAGLLVIVLPTVVYNLIALLPVYALARLLQRRATSDALTPADSF